ncbi:unnamed protein product, partial [Musa textilis]
KVLLVLGGANPRVHRGNVSAGKPVCGGRYLDVGKKGRATKGALYASPSGNDDQAAVSAPRMPGGASRPIRVRAATSLLEHVADANISPDKGKGDAQAS